VLSKAEFVQECGKLLNMAKPNLLECEYALGKNIGLSKTEKLIGQVVVPEDEYVLVNFDSGRYIINVTANSLCAIAKDIINKMMDK